MASKEYKAMKNFMHNECGVSKENIRDIIREEVREQVKAANPQDIIEREVIKRLTSTLHWGGSDEAKRVINDTNSYISHATREAIERVITQNILIVFREITGKEEKE
jgi:hypothetical protein